MRSASGAASATFSSPGSDTELSIWAAPNVPAPARHARGAAGIEDFERADRRQHDRQAQLAAEQLDRRIDLGDVAQHPRPERDLVQRHAVAPHGGLGLGGADDVVPGVLVEIGPRLARRIRAGSGIPQLLAPSSAVAAGRMRVLRSWYPPGNAGVRRADRLGLSPIASPSFHAIPKIAMAAIGGTAANDPG